MVSCWVSRWRDTEGMLNMSTFIAMDPPTHDVQRKTVAGSVSPTNLGNMEALIRERTRTVLDALPVGGPSTG